MPDITDFQVQCVHCREWILSPIAYGNTEAFETGGIYDSTFQCSDCGEISPIAKGNIRWKLVGGGGGYVGDDTKSS